MPCFVVRESDARTRTKSASGGRADGVWLLGRFSSDWGCRTAGPPVAGAANNWVTIDASDACGGRCSMVLAMGLTTPWVM